MSTTDDSSDSVGFYGCNLVLPIYVRVHVLMSRASSMHANQYGQYTCINGQGILLYMQLSMASIHVLTDRASFCTCNSILLIYVY